MQLNLDFEIAKAVPVHRLVQIHFRDRDGSPLRRLSQRFTDIPDRRWSFRDHCVRSAE